MGVNILLSCIAGPVISPMLVNYSKVCFQRSNQWAWCTTTNIEYAHLVLALGLKRKTYMPYISELNMDMASQKYIAPKCHGWGILCGGWHLWTTDSITLHSCLAVEGSDAAEPVPPHISWLLHSREECCLRSPNNSEQSSINLFLFIFAKVGISLLWNFLTIVSNMMFNQKCIIVPI